MKRFILFIILLLFTSCEDYYGKPVPLGDEFEDYWQKSDFKGLIYDIKASKINSDEFFIAEENNLYVVKDSVAMLIPFEYSNHHLATLTSSFLHPQRLLAGTDDGHIYYCSMNEVLREINISGLNSTTFLSFSPYDTTTILISDGYLLLKSSLSSIALDTLFYNSDRIVNLVVQESGEIFLATEHSLFRSAIQDSLWDTLFVSTADLISDFAIDGQQKLYLSTHNRILKSETGVNWSEFYSDTFGNLSIAGIDAGLVLVYPNGTNVNAFKLNADGEIYDITMGIVNTFSYLSDLPALIVVSGNKYLISFTDGDEQESTLFSFFDTLLPP